MTLNVFPRSWFLVSYVVSYHQPIIRLFSYASDSLCVCL